jgi:CRP/FNR family cyclic AMP-dependent transcriptional regulator
MHGAPRRGRQTSGAPNGSWFMQANAKHHSFYVRGLLTQYKKRRTETKFAENQILYSQGDPADSVFYIYKGEIKISIFSERGKEAIVAILGPDEFCGEGAMSGKPLRLSTATAMSTCEIIRLEKRVVARLLHQETEFAEHFLHHLLNRTARVEANLADQLFNSSEMRLARALLLLAHYGNNVDQEPISVKVNQETLAALVGTTRPRVNFFMNRFRNLGLIDYNNNGRLEVREGMLNFVQGERPHIEAQNEKDSH